MTALCTTDSPSLTADHCQLTTGGTMSNSPSRLTEAIPKNLCSSRSAWALPRPASSTSPYRSPSSSATTPPGISILRRHALTSTGLARAGSGNVFGEGHRCRQTFGVFFTSNRLVNGETPKVSARARGANRVRLATYECADRFPRQACPVAPSTSLADQVGAETSCGSYGWTLASVRNTVDCVTTMIWHSRERLDVCIEFENPELYAGCVS